MTEDTGHFDATLDKLDSANQFLNTRFDQYGVSETRRFSILLALEEIFVNICHYAYPDGEKTGDIKIVFREESDAWILEMTDQGVPFDILSLPAPDTTLNVSERPIGGLGIYLIRTLADNIRYRRANDQNILCMTFLKKEPD